MSLRQFGSVYLDIADIVSITPKYGDVYVTLRGNPQEFWVFCSHENNSVDASVDARRFAEQLAEDVKKARGK